MSLSGFALNLGPEDWQYDGVVDCLTVANELSEFKLFPSFDMNCIPSTSPSNIELLLKYLRPFVHHPNAFRHENKLVVSTFAGQQSFFGQLSLDEGWNLVKSTLSQELETAIHFVPAFFVDPATYPDLSCLDGVFHWNGAWPTDFSLHTTDRSRENPDMAHFRNLKNQTYMAGVSPWFFTHYGPDSWNKNWVYNCQNHHFVRRWKQIIAMRDMVDWVQLISWNDYGESHYTKPLPPPHHPQPNSQSWVNGFPHDAFLHLNSYFAKAFINGSYPPIESDAIYFWARPHSKSVERVADEIGEMKPAGWEMLHDKAYMVIFAPSPGTECVVSTPSANGHSSLTQIHPINGPMTLLEHDPQPDSGLSIVLRRAGQVIASCAPSLEEFCFSGPGATPKTWNFNVYCGMSREN